MYEQERMCPFYKDDLSFLIIVATIWRSPWFVRRLWCQSGRPKCFSGCSVVCRSVVKHRVEVVRHLMSERQGIDWIAGLIGEHKKAGKFSVSTTPASKTMQPITTGRIGPQSRLCMLTEK